MKKVKIKFVGFPNNFDPKHNLYLYCLEKHYIVEFSDEPDYIFCSMFGIPYDYINYSGIRIFCSGENYSPDFTSVDYAIGFDPMVYTDRYLRMPVFYFDERAEHLESVDNELYRKKYFCNFIYSHKSANGIREDIFNVLQQYKRVESAGTYLNNMDNHYICSTYEQKINLLRQSKFTIACESVEQDGFVTEKILHALYAGSIPIYFGSKSIENDFNPQCLIDYRNFKSMSSLVQYVQHLDNNDYEYNEICKKQKFASNNQYNKQILLLDDFLLTIFEQNKDKAYRRPRYFQPQGHEKRLLLLNKIYKFKPEKIFHFVYQIISRLKL